MAWHGKAQHPGGFVTGLQPLGEREHHAEGSHQTARYLPTRVFMKNLSRTLKISHLALVLERRCRL
jgi:hypothetical protein